MGEATGAVLGVVVGLDLFEGGGVVEQAKGWVAEGVAGVEGAAGAEVGGIGGETGNGVEFGVFVVDGGDALEQGAGVGVQGIAKEFGGGGGFDDTAGIHDFDAVTDLGDDGQIVGDEDDGHAEFLLVFFDQLEDFGLHGDVERGGGFVGYENLWFGDQGHGNHDTLPHAAGEFMGVGLDTGFWVGDADFAERAGGGFESIAFTGIGMQQQGFDQLLADAQERVQRGHGILEDHANAATADAAQFFFTASE